MKWRLLLIVFYAFALANVIIFINFVFAGWEARVLLDAYLNLTIVVIFFVLLPYVLYKNSSVFRAAVQFIFYSLPFLRSALRRLCVSRFASSMALGIKAGNEIRDTIRFSAASMENPILERRALRAVGFIEQGDTIAESLAKTGVFPRLISQMYMTGEQSGKLFETMDHIAGITQEQAENALKTITTVFVFLVYLTLIGVVGFIIIRLWLSIIGRMTSIGI